MGFLSSVSNLYMLSELGKSPHSHDMNRHPMPRIVAVAFDIPGLGDRRRLCLSRGVGGSNS
jgi:hypothetical protein